VPARVPVIATGEHAPHHGGPSHHDQAAGGCHVCRLAGSLELPSPAPELGRAVVFLLAVEPDGAKTGPPPFAPLDLARPPRGPPTA
jgi:hypothetical protein